MSRSRACEASTGRGSCPVQAAAARSIDLPSTLRVTWMLPRVALEYGHRWSARAMRSAASAGERCGALRSSDLQAEAAVAGRADPDSGSDQGVSGIKLAALRHAQQRRLEAGSVAHRGQLLGVGTRAALAAHVLGHRQHLPGGRRWSGRGQPGHPARSPRRCREPCSAAWLPSCNPSFMQRNVSSRRKVSSGVGGAANNRSSAFETGFRTVVRPHRQHPSGPPVGWSLVVPTTSSPVEVQERHHGEDTPSRPRATNRPKESAVHVEATRASDCRTSARGGHLRVSIPWPGTVAQSPVGPRRPTGSPRR